MNYFLWGASLRGAKNSVHTLSPQKSISLLFWGRRLYDVPHKQGSSWVCVSAQGTPSSESHIHPQGCLLRGVQASGSYQQRAGQSESFGMWHHPRGYISNFLVRQASSWCALGRSVTPSTQSRRKDTPVAIRRGEGAQMRWCGEHGCYPRVRPVSWGTLGVPSWVPSTVLHFSRNVGLLLRRCGGQGPHAAKTMEPRGFSRVVGMYGWVTRFSPMWACVQLCTSVSEWWFGAAN